MRFKILLIAIIVITAILAFTIYKQSGVPTHVSYGQARLIGTVQETRQVTIGSQDYIDKYIDWQFREINNTHWTADFSFTEPFFSDLRRCLDNPSDMTCWNYIQNAYLPDYNLNEIRTDLLNLANYPLRNLTSNWRFSNFNINLASGTGSFTINFPNGFKEGEYAELGFGSTIISTSTSASLFSPGGKSICRTTNRIHVAYPSSTVRYTNSTDGITWGNSIQLDGSQGNDNPNVNVFVECSGNNVFVSWHDNTGGHRYMNSSNEGATWSSNATGGMAPSLTVMPSSSSSTPISSAMLLPNTNNIFLASWNQSVVGARVLNTSTYTGVADPSNTNTSIFAPVSSNKHPPAIYINSSGAIFVAIKSGSDNDFYFNFSSDEGSTWTGAKVSGAVTYNYPDIVQMNGTIFIVTHDSGDDIRLHNSTNDGVTWGSPVRIDTIGSGASKAQYPSLTTDGANLYVFWQENDTANNRYWDIRYRKWNISNGWDNVVYWQNFTNGTNGGSTAEPRPNAKRGNSNNLIEVVWANRTTTSGDIDVMYDYISIAPDTTNPRWSNNKTNSTLAGTPIIHSLRWTDDIGLSGYIFQFCNGTWNGSNCGASETNETYLIHASAGETSPFYPNLRTICRDGQKNLHTVWQNTSDTIVYANSSNGINWNVNNTIVNSTSTKQNPSISCDGNNISIAYNNKVYLSTDNGANFDDISSSYNGEYTQVEIRGQRIYLLHDSNFTYSTNQGTSWELTKQILSGAPFPSMVVDGNGTSIDKIYAVIKTGADEIYFTNSTDGGTTFGVNITIIDDMGFGMNDESITYQGCNLYVAVTDLGGQLRFTNSTDCGLTWTKNYTIPESVTARDVSVAYDNNNNPWIFFHNNTNIYYVKYNGTNWEGQVTLHTNARMPSAKYNYNNNKIEYMFLNNTVSPYPIVYGYFSFTEWVNDTWTSMTGGDNWSNVTKIVNSTIGANVAWCVYVNDTSNNWNGTSCLNPFTYTTTTDTTKPTWNNNATNSTLAGTWVDHSVVLSDDVGLSFYFFEFDNGTGSLNNITNMSISGSQVTANQTVLINSTFNSTVRWRYYFNDTSNNWNSTYLFNYTTSGIILSFVPPTQDNATTITVNSTYINVSVTQNTSAIDTILFQWNFSGKNTNVTIYNTSELVGLWHLNNDTLDYSGNGNDLTLANGVNCSANVQGRFGTACDFAGDDDRLDGGSNSSIDDIFTGGGTAMAWIYLDSYGTNNQAYIAGKGTPGTSGWIFWVVNTMGQNAIQFNTYFSTFGAWVASDELSTGRWIHVAVMYNDGATTNDPVLYVNGKNVTIDSETTPTGTYQSDAANNTFIGGTPTGNTRNFNGTIDEVRFYKRILSSDEINITYRSELGKYINSTVFFQNFTDMADGVYRYKSYGKMTDGTWNSSEERTLTVAIPPIWSNNQSSIPSKYSTALSIFNITWTDNAAISIAFLESNFSGSPTNYTMWSTGNVYSYNNTLPAGSFYWKSYANDTSNNWNVSDAWYFTIDKGTLELSITSPQTVTYPVQTTVTGSETNIGDTDVTYQLWRNSSATNPLSLTTETNALGVGAHLYTYNTTHVTFANWTANTTGVNTTVTVSQNQTNPINIFFTNSTGTYKNQNITIDYGESTTANATLVYSNAGTASLFEDNSSVANPRTTTLSAGNHSYKGNTSGNVNHTANATGAIYYITVNPVAYAISINLNATQVWWNDSVNLSGYATSTGSPFSGWIQVNRSNDTTTMCNTTTSNGYYSCVFYAPLEIGNYNYTSYMLSQTGSALVGNSTILTVMLSYGSEYPGKNVGVYEAPVIIQELSGKIKIVWVKIKTWFNR